MSTLELKELSHPSGEVIKIASGKTLDLKSQGTTTLPTGSVLQVVQATSTTTQTTTSSSFIQYSSLTATITPTSTSSKILISSTVEANIRLNGGSNMSTKCLIYRDSSAVSREIEMRGYDYGGSGLYLVGHMPIEHLDAPSTTSAITYSIYYRNLAGTDTNINSGSITLMEIQG